MDRRSAGLLVPLLLLAGTSPAFAQQQAHGILGPAASMLFAGSRPAVQADTADTTAAPQPTRWKRGLIIGGAIGAVGLGGFVFALCEGLSESGTSCVGSGLAAAGLGAFMGGVIGALIGGQFPKENDP